MIDKKQFPILPPLPFENTEYVLRITHTVDTDLRIMTFTDTLWGFEVTGGYDQYEPLTVIAVNRSGYAKRAGIRVNDRIVQINDTYADTLTLKEAQLLIRESGRHVKIYVQGDGEPDPDEYTVDFWFTPPNKRIYVENKWRDNFPWNDRRKPKYKESNCFMVPSKAEQRIVERILEKLDPVMVTESADNVVQTAEQNVVTSDDANSNSEKPENSAEAKTSVNGIDKGR